MSQNLSSQSDTSTIDSAVVTASDSPQGSVANATDTPAESTTDTTASGKDASIEELDRQYKENLLAADKPEPEAQPDKSQAKPEETVEAKPEETVEVEEPEQDEPEAQTGPRTFEQLKKQFPRVTEAPLKEIERVDAELHALQTEMNSVGGPVALELAKAILPALLTSPSTEEEATATADSVFQAVTETNPGLMQRMSWQILTHSLNEESPDPATGKPINIVTGDALIKQYLNEKYDVDTLNKLIAYDEAGLLDREELDRELETYSGKSERERQLEERLKALEAGKQQEQAAEENKKAERIQQHVAKTEAYVSDGAMQRVVAIAKEYGWTATPEEINSTDPEVKANAEFKVALGELLTPWLDNYVRSHVKWAGIESIGKNEQAFNADGNPTVLLKKNGEDLINAAVAAFKGKVRVMNKAFQKMAGQSRNAKLKEKLTTRSGAVDPSEIPPVKKPQENGNRPMSDEFARLDEEYRRAVRG